MLANIVEGMLEEADVVTLTDLRRKNTRQRRVSRRSSYGMPPFHRFSSELAQCSARDQMTLDVESVVDRGVG